MPRSEHFLFRARPSPWPRAVVCLSVIVDWSKREGEERREYAALKQWHITLVQKLPGGYSVTRSACGGTVDGFWSGLGECLTRTGGVYLICGNTRAASAALQLWEGLENGTIKVKGSDHRTTREAGRNLSPLPGGGGDTGLGQTVAMAADGVSEMRGSVGEKTRGRRKDRRQAGRGSAGIMILEDPPIVMELELDGSAGKLTWVDVGNYGLDSSGMFGDDEHTAGKVAEWFMGAATTIKQCGDAGWQNTAGSQAMHLFRSSYLDTQILSHCQPVASSLEGSALFGGRCECYRIGRIAGPCHMLDIRSMYPYLCSVLDVPVRLSRILDGPDVDALRDVCAVSFAVADVDIETDSPDYPYRSGNAVRYPVGRFATYLCGAELCYALSVGAVRRVRRAAVYESERALGRYAETLYRMRQAYDRANNATQSGYVKRLMVSLVGKFAQRERSWAECPNAESAFEWGEWYSRDADGNSERWRSIGGYIQRELLGGFGHGAVPAITAAITSAGRDRLRRIMDTAGRESVIYCDTDAVVVDDYGAERLTLAGWIRPGEWGCLQPVESADGCVIYGDKAYSIGGRTRCAGAPRGGTSGTGEPTQASAQPWIGWSMKHQQQPADWREPQTYTRTEGRYDRPRAPGGIVRPMELWEW